MFSLSGVQKYNQPSAGVGGSREREARTVITAAVLELQFSTAHVIS